MARDIGLANRLRDAGLRVVEVAGWQTRGSASFHPRGSVDHHTAGGASGNAPSLSICIYGRSGLPGPLCNVLIGRDNTCYVIAAGRANHAGRGGWNGMSGNSSVYGIERENVGYNSREPWRTDQTETAARAHASFGVAPGNVCEHKEWTSRKIDAHTIKGVDMRALVAHYQGTTSPPPKPTPTPTPTQSEQGVIDMFLLVNDYGLFAVVDGVPSAFPNLAAYALAKKNSPGTPVMWLERAQGEPLVRNLLKKFAAQSQ